MVASSVWRLTGFVRWASKPAFWERSTSSCMTRVGRAVERGETQGFMINAKGERVTSTLAYDKS